jgi:thiamine biosynthesis lipoprotein
MLAADRLSDVHLFQREGFLVGKFSAMGCDCEILMDTNQLDVARALVRLGSTEARRIEKKFSRYRSDSVVRQINSKAGSSVEVDDETAQLLDFAERCHELSDGLFDISSGVLRRAWTFDGGDRMPAADTIRGLLQFVGWKKIAWQRPVIKLAVGMEIDLGGIGKEYAVDRTLQLLQQHSDLGILVNYGGDIAVGGKRRDGMAWRVGIEDSRHIESAVKNICLKQGAIATSGDARKFVVVGGKRYGHILNPQTGWPVADGFRSVTVAADSCSEAGFLSTCGILNGQKASEFLRDAGVQSWCY